MRKMLAGLVLLALLAVWPVAAGAEGIAPAAVFGDGELATVFTQATGNSADPSYFGVYSITPVEERLYLGVGAARPGEFDGSLLAEWDATGLRPLAVLQEQGFIDAQLVGNRLYIPGPDPTDDWTAGNVYIHDLTTGVTTKQRSLPNVLHDWGLWRADDGRLFVATGRHLGDNATWAGGIFVSADDGQTWTLDGDPQLGAYRTYDVLGSDGGLVAIAADDYTTDCPAVIKPPGGAWQRPGAWVVCRQRLALDPTGRRVFAVGAGGTSLVEPLTGRKLRLPFQVEPWAYNWQAIAGRTLYVLAANGRVMATDDLRTWRAVAAFDQPLVSLAHWPSQHALVVATRGAAGGVFIVLLAQ